MQIEITPETILKQLKIGVNEKNLAQMGLILKNTKDGERFFKHLFSLNDALATINSFIAPSNSVELLKIKYHGSDDLDKEQFHTIVKNWSDKYRVSINKVDNKETYYIQGLLD